MRVFVAGGTGVIGRSLIPMLITAGHQVTATTRSPGKAGLLRSLGAEPAVADGLDRGATHEAVARARPDVIIHQMTGLTGAGDMRHFDRTFAVTNALRTIGTDYLLEAARATGTGRFIAQSFTGWPNARDGGPVKTEDDPLDPDPPATMTESMRAIRHLEAAVTGRSPHGPSTPGGTGGTGEPEGLVLRYGILYGPGASDDIVGLVRKRRLPVIGGGTGVWLVHPRDRRRLRRGHRRRTGPPRDLQRGGRRPGAGRRVAALPGRDDRRAATVAGTGRAGPPAGRRLGGLADDPDPRLVQRPGAPRARLGSPVRELAVWFRHRSR